MHTSGVIRKLVRPGRHASCGVLLYFQQEIRLSAFPPPPTPQHPSFQISKLRVLRAMVSIPKTQTAILFEKHNTPLKIVTDHPVVQQSQLKPGEALVKLAYTGVCHTDLRELASQLQLPPRERTDLRFQMLSREIGRLLLNFLSSEDTKVQDISLRLETVQLLH